MRSMRPRLVRPFSRQIICGLDGADFGAIVSSSDGSWPSGVRSSTAVGRSRLKRVNISSGERPVLAAQATATCICCQKRRLAARMDVDGCGICEECLAP